MKIRNNRPAFPLRREPEQLSVTERLRLAFPLREERIGELGIGRRLHNYGLRFTNYRHCPFLRVEVRAEGQYIVNKLIEEKKQA